MVQITTETMVELRRSLREMKDYTVICGRPDQSDSQETVCVQWVEEKCPVNKGWVHRGPCLIQLYIVTLTFLQTQVLRQLLMQNCLYCPYQCYKPH